MILILGGGISGLSLAYFLQKKSIKYTLLEASNRFGGVIETEFCQNSILENGANSLMIDEKLEELISELHLTPLLANQVSSNRYILKNKKLQILPAHPIKLLLGNFFSFRTKILFIKELFAKPQPNLDDISISDFFEQKFGKEVLEYAVAPFISGIYSGNPDHILLAKTFPKLMEAQKEYGSLLKYFAKNASKAKRRKTITFAKGMIEFTEALASKINHKHLNVNANGIYKKGNNWLVKTDTGSEFEGDKIVFCTPSYVIQPLVSDFFPSFAHQLSQIKYSQVSILHLVYHKNAILMPLNGFGSLHPRNEKSFLTGVIWNSSVFGGRTKENETLFTCFLGGEQSFAPSDYSDDELINKSIAELEKLYQITEKPVISHLKHWKSAIPQYTKETIGLETLILDVEKQNIFILSNIMNGVSIPDRITQSQLLADKIA